MKSKYLLRIFLLIVLVVSTVSVISMMVAISATESENQALEDQIQEQKLRNSEKSELLDEENEEDFYRDIAENVLGYGYGNEKVYVNISGQ
mgnify:CR=1 FL=1